jgi:hypothetical protein
VILYGRETSSLILREKQRLRVFVMRRIFEPKGDEVTKGWRKLHNEKLLNLYFSPSLIIIMKSRLNKTYGLVQHEGLGKLNKFIHLIASPSRNILDCSILP